MQRPTRPWLLLAPVPATLVGAAVAYLHGVPFVAFLPNLIAFVVGAAGLLWLTREARKPIKSDFALWCSVAATLAIVATLLAPGLADVHRWLPVGPLRINASAALAPWLYLALADGARRRRLLGMGLACLVQGVHLLQPDGAQALALALGTLPFTVGAVRAARLERWASIAAALLLLGLTVAAWSRPEPLPGLPHVERVLALTMARGPNWIAAGIGATAALFLPALLALRGGSREGGRLGASCALYLAAQLGATFAGAYPVPVFGAGAGPLLGWWALAAICLIHTPNVTSTAPGNRIVVGLPPP